MASGGPWGGGGNQGDDDQDRQPDKRPQGGRKPNGDGGQMPEIDEIMRKGQEQLRVLMGGKGRGGLNGGGGGGQGDSPMLTKQVVAIGAFAAVALWSWVSFYQVQQDQRSVELLFGQLSTVGESGLNFAPWPFETYQVVSVTGERNTDIATGADGATESGLMLTGDQNIVDVGFQVVWNVSDPALFLFNLADPEGTIRAVSESAMRDIVARSELSPILSRDRNAIGENLKVAVQETLDSYDAGINVIRVNLQRADVPAEVIDSFREVQAAQQERDRLEKEADAYANRVTAGARGEAARLLEDAEAYRAQVVNAAEGEASRFLSVYEEYVKAPEVTRRRMYLETMEKVLGGMNKVILDGVASGEGGGQGVVPFLPLNELNQPAARAGAATEGSN